MAFKNTFKTVALSKLELKVPNGVVGSRSKMADAEMHLLPGHNWKLLDK
jgi:hypothetical protein